MSNLKEAANEERKSEQQQQQQQGKSVLIKICCES